MAGLAARVQLVAWATWAVRVVVPPLAGTALGETKSPVIDGATGVAAETVTLTLAFFDDDPVAERVRVYLAVLVEVLAGRITGVDTDPDAQETDSGRPVTTGLEVSEQLVALVTVAATVLEPPAEDNEVGVAERSVMAGAVDAADAGIEGVTTTSPPTTITTGAMTRATFTEPRPLLISASASAARLTR